jgi:chromosomal replication initiator protein
MIMIASIQNTIAAEFDTPPSDMKSDRRDWRSCAARQVAMFLSREMTRKSFPEIARFFGDRHHTTVMHAVGKVSEMIAESDEFADRVAVLRLRLSGG